MADEDPKPAEPVTRPDPNVVPPAPVLVQEGFSPGEDARRPNPSVKPPERAVVQEMEKKDSTPACPEKKGK